MTRLSPQSQMKPLFTQGPSVTLRLVFFSILSLTLLTIDHRQDHLESVRAKLSALIYPLQFSVNLPTLLSRWLGDELTSSQGLTDSNLRLARENLLLKAQLQKFSALEVENTRLRELLQSAHKLDERLLIAELLAVDMDPFRHKITLNKGSRAGVIAGQPLLDSAGVMGQIVHVGPYTSTALLITDPSHALPVQVNRNGLRAIAIGTGSLNRLDLPHLAKNADVRVGDLLITSGLGGGFPADYPVARIVSVERDPNLPFAKVTATPSARLERSREVLLVWPTAPKPAAPIPVTPAPSAPLKDTGLLAQTPGKQPATASPTSKPVTPVAASKPPTGLTATRLAPASLSPAMTATSRVDEYTE